MEGPNIPTLPIVEKDGNVASRDIFQPLDQVESSPHARVGTPSTSPLPPHSRLLVHTGSPLPSSPASPTSGKFYCSVCKKAFNNEATWSNHQNSAKHLNNVKEASRTSSGDMGKVIGRAAENSEDARQKLKQAEKISSTNPAVAASVYWNVAKGALHKTHHPQDTSRALQSLIRLIEEREQTLPPVGASGVTKEATSQLTPSQASMTLYLARLALARLNASYVVGVAVARVLYAKALEERWKVDVQEVDGVAQNLSALPLSTLTAMLESSLEGSDVLAKLSKPPKDPNLVAHLVLREAALVHARRLGEEDGAAHAAEGKALVWAGMAGVVCRLEGRYELWRVVLKVISFDPCWNFEETGIDPEPFVHEQGIDVGTIEFIMLLMGQGRCECTCSHLKLSSHRPLGIDVRIAHFTLVCGRLPRGCRTSEPGRNLNPNRRGDCKVGIDLVIESGSAARYGRLVVHNGCDGTGGGNRRLRPGAGDSTGRASASARRPFSENRTIEVREWIYGFGRRLPFPQYIVKYHVIYSFTSISFPPPLLSGHAHTRPRLPAAFSHQRGRTYRAPPELRYGRERLGAPAALVRGTVPGSGREESGVGESGWGGESESRGCVICRGFWGGCQCRILRY
ncbi:hypothetical protein BC936DRAFT_145875 [Jimgerdemannia flammicorona]|uniref:C2H2-type domain-containing protein n=1 Tax=Jimgerdemannia flammicorona TaxID=994334 RepID=A0A433D8V4_9FUNG|nr:hypothetical protein BC936DRAFT_145875 [Jimgerdemannia flammicorona]